jgi:hypothetical protein
MMKGMLCQWTFSQQKGQLPTFKPMQVRVAAVWKCMVPVSEEDAKLFTRTADKVAPSI